MVQRFLLVLILIVALLLPTQPAIGAKTLQGAVTSVLDGDTLVVKLGRREERVRLIGVDAPEKGQGLWGRRAKRYVEERALGWKVSLELDVQERDRYGRLLAYVYIDGSMLNEELLQAGLAMLLTIPPNVRYADRFLALQREARSLQVGIWHPRSGLAESPSEYRRAQREGERVAKKGAPGWLVWVGAIAILLMWFLRRASTGKRRWAGRKRRGGI